MRSNLRRYAPFLLLALLALPLAAGVFALLWVSDGLWVQMALWLILLFTGCAAYLLPLIRYFHRRKGLRVLPCAAYAGLVNAAAAAINTGVVFGDYNIGELGGLLWLLFAFQIALSSVILIIGSAVVARKKEGVPHQTL